MATNILIEKVFQAIWILTATLFFIFFHDFLVCQAGPEKVYMAWNHAMVFWVFLVLGVRKTIGTTRAIFLIKFYLLFSYFAGGVAKIKHGGEWMNGYTLQYYFLQRHIDLDTPLAWNLVANLSVSKIVSYIIVLSELLIPIAFLNKKIEWVFVVGCFIFQGICWYTMKLNWMNYYGWTYLIYASILIVNYIHENSLIHSWIDLA